MHPGKVNKIDPCGKLYAGSFLVLQDELSLCGLHIQYWKMHESTLKKIAGSYLVMRVGLRNNEFCLCGLLLLVSGQPPTSDFEILAKVFNCVSSVSMLTKHCLFGSSLCLECFLVQRGTCGRLRCFRMWTKKAVWLTNHQS